MNHSISPEQLLGQLHWRYATKQFDAARKIDPQLWSALEDAVSRSPVKGIILERDEHLPPLADLLDEVDRARSIGRRHGRWG